jgi:hypothetical protein
VWSVVPLLGQDRAGLEEAFLGKVVQREHRAKSVTAQLSDASSEVITTEHVQPRPEPPLTSRNGSIMSVCRRETRATNSWNAVAPDPGPRAQPYRKTLTINIERVS